MAMFVDIVAVVIILGCALMAYKQGFVKTFFGLITVILAVVFASMFDKSLAAYIKANTELDEFINSIVTEAVGSIEEGVNNSAKHDDLAGLVATSSFDFSGLNGMMDEAGNMVEGLANNSFINQLPDTIANKININELTGDFVNGLSSSIADIVINVMSWIIIYIVTQFVLNIIARILDGIMVLPLLREINNLAGLAIGLVLGLFRLYVILAIIYVVATFVNISPVVNVITSSSFVGALYNNNLLLKLIF